MTRGRNNGVDGGLYQIRISQNDMYDIPNRRLLQHRLPGVGYLRIGALRAPLDPPYFFAQEGMIDELAHEARLDPYEFRKRNISHPRWLGVLKAAADAANWTPRVAASAVSKDKIVAGRGIGPGLLDCPERGIHAVDVIAQRAEIDGVLPSTAADVKYLASDPPLALQSDYCRLRFPDHPRRAVGCIGVVEDRQRRCWSLWSRSHSLTVEAQAWFRSTVNPLASRTCRSRRSADGSGLWTSAGRSSTGTRRSASKTATVPHENYWSMA